MKKLIYLIIIALLVNQFYLTYKIKELQANTINSNQPIYSLTKAAYYPYSINDMDDLENYLKALKNDIYDLQYQVKDLKNLSSEVEDIKRDINYIKLSLY